MFSRAVWVTIRSDMEQKKILLASDHAGYSLKEYLKKYLQQQGYPVEDVGTHSPESVDWPDLGARAAAKVSAEPDTLRGVVICGTGLGMSMICNKFRQVRAALCHTCYEARMSRRHNNANILNLGGRVLGKRRALAILKVWLRTEFEGGRHQRRLDIFSRIEKENFK